MRIRKFIRHFGYERLLRGVMVVVACCLAGAVVFRIVTPVRLRLPDTGLSVQAGTGAQSGLLFDPNAPDQMEHEAVLGSLRRGLFKSATPLRDRPIADKTIAKIRSQLSLGCILETNGESVAYIRVKDLGLKRCRVGDSVEDLFTVLDIREKSVAISIVDHRVMLSL